MRTFVWVMKHIISTDFTLGILGGGQLGKMLLDVTRRWDIRTHVLDSNAEASARNGCDHFVEGDLMDYNTVIEFGKDVDVLTIEIESVNVDALYALEKQGIFVYPTPTTLEVIQNKRTQKEFYRSHNLPTAPFLSFQNKDKLADAVQKGLIKFPCIWKAARFGYDGFGVKKLDAAEDVQALPDSECVIEDLVPIAQEISVIVARSASSEIALYPAVGMAFHPTANQVEFVYHPAKLDETIAVQAQDIAKKLVASWEHVGLLAVEFFVDNNNTLWINEVAPRPHNSGHLTIEGCITSQFEQHLRAILDAPLGKTDFYRPTIMANVVGPQNLTGEFSYEGIETVLSTPQAGLHIYGKKTTKPQRKMGHITLTGDDLNTIFKKIKELKSVLQLKAK